MRQRAKLLTKIFFTSCLCVFSLAGNRTARAEEVSVTVAEYAAEHADEGEESAGEEPMVVDGSVLSAETESEDGYASDAPEEEAQPGVDGAGDILVEVEGVVELPENDGTKIQLQMQEEAALTSAYAAGTSVGSATAVSVNTACSDRLGSANEKYYSFSLTSAGYVTLSFSHEYVDRSGTNWFGDLYDSQQKRFFTCTYEGNTSVEKTSSPIGLPAGTYYFRVERNLSYYDASYSFSINYTASDVWETEFNDTAYTADQIPVNKEIYGCIADGYDKNDYFKFVLTEPGYVSASFSHEYDDRNGTFWDMCLSDANEKQLVRLGCEGRSSAAASTQNIGLPAGTYYVRIGQWGSGSYSTKQYSLNVNYTASSGWETEFNDTAYTADPVAAGKEIRGSIREFGDVDCYVVQVPLDNYYQIVFNRPYIDAQGSGWNIDLYDQNYVNGSSAKKLNSFSYNCRGTSDTTGTFYLSRGTYYLRLSSGQSGTPNGDYSVLLREHPHVFRTEVVEKATMYADGKALRRCVCGYISATIVIYHPKSITLSSTQYSCNGKAKKPSVTVTGSDGKVIPSDCYKVSYAKGRKKVGRYAVKISFAGNYSGSAKRYFEIVPKETKIKKLKARSRGFSVKIARQNKQTSGYQIQYSVESDFSGSTIKTIKGSSKTSAVYRKLKAKKTYYVRVRTFKKAAGKKYYSAWSAAKKVVTKK